MIFRSTTSCRCSCDWRLFILARSIRIKDGKIKILEKWNFDIDFEANFDNKSILLENGHSVYGENLEIEKNDKHSDWKEETFTGNRLNGHAILDCCHQYWYGNLAVLKTETEQNYELDMDIEVYYKNEKDYYSEGSRRFCWIL